MQCTVLVVILEHCLCIRMLDHQHHCSEVVRGVFLTPRAVQICCSSALVRWKKKNAGQINGEDTRVIVFLVELKQLLYNPSVVFVSSRKHERFRRCCDMGRPCCQ